MKCTACDQQAISVVVVCGRELALCHDHAEMPLGMLRRTLGLPETPEPTGLMSDVQKPSALVSTPSYVGVLFPEEALELWKAVLGGHDVDGNPERMMDAMLLSAYRSFGNESKYVATIMQAVSDVKCLDCVMARLNLHMLSEAAADDKIEIRFGRRAQLPGYHRMQGMIEDEPAHVSPSVDVEKLIEDKTNDLKDMVRAFPKLTSKMAIQTANDQMSEIEQEIECLKAKQAMQAVPANQPESGVSFGGGELVDGSVYFEYPDDAKSVDQLADEFYESSTVVSRSNGIRPLPADVSKGLSAWLSKTGYDAVDSVEKAWARLERLTREKTPEQNIVGRLGYLLITGAIGRNPKKFLDAIGAMAKMRPALLAR